MTHYCKKHAHPAQTPEVMAAHGAVLLRCRAWAMSHDRALLIACLQAHPNAAAKQSVAPSRCTRLPVPASRRLRLVLWLLASDQNIANSANSLHRIFADIALSICI